jgi:hypothetical protein
MKNKPLRKITAITPNGNRVVFRRRNPKMVLAIIAVLIVLSSLIYGVLVYMDDFTFMFAVAIVAILFPWFVQIHSMTREEHLHAMSMCARIVGVRFNKSKIILTIKNIGSLNIVEASLGDILIDEKIPIVIPTIINLLPIGEAEDISISLPFRLANISKLSYKIGIAYGNTFVLRAYEQEIWSNKGKCTMRSNTCKLKTWIYHRWWI